MDRRTYMTKLVVSFRNLANAPKSFILSTGSSFVLAVPSYRLFLRTGCSFVPAVPTYRLFLPTGCSYVPAVPSYRLLLLTGFSFLPVVPSYRLFLRTDCFYASTNQQQSTAQAAPHLRNIV